MKVSRFIQLAPVDWEKTLDRMKSNEHFKLANELDAMTQRLARCFGYVDHRYGSGCGDQGHAKAVKNANKLGAAVRKAMGYSYPKLGDINI